MTRAMQKKTIWDLNRPSVEEFKQSEKLPLAIVLDNVRSLNNIGSIFRTSDGFGAEKVVLCGISTPPPSPEIHKTALGAENSVDWEYFPDTMEAVRTLRERGYALCCLEQVHGSVKLQDFAPSPGKKYALVVGHEVEGVNPEVVDACDICLEIPQVGTKHSLNVAVSAGLAIWQFFSANH